MSNDDIYCAKCNKSTEETLLLSCQHNLCIPCAAENLSRQNQNNNNEQIIICDICKSQTEIDSETSKEILSYVINTNQKLFDNNSNSNLNEQLNTLINNNNNLINKDNIENDFLNNNDEQLNISNFSKINNQTSNNNNFVNFTYFNNNNNNNNQNLNNPSNNFGNSFNLSLVSQKDVCSEHGEPISYLCMDCMSKCICSECIVHGIHKTHEVITIKKAYPLIYNKTNELINYVQDKIKEINITNGNLEKKKIDIANINDKIKSDIKNAFEEIRIKLGMKEKEIIEKSESTLMDNIQEINTYGRILQSKAISLNKIIETLNAYLMRKDELLLINFYVENKNKILNQSEVNELNKIPELENLSNLRIDLDKSSFDIMINALNNLHFEINTMKGFNYNLNYDTQKFLAQRNLYGYAYKNNISEENPLNFTNNFNNSSQQINNNNNNNNLNEENNLNESNNNINNNNNNNSNV